MTVILTSASMLAYTKTNGLHWWPLEGLTGIQ